MKTIKILLLAALMILSFNFKIYEENITTIKNKTIVDNIIKDGYYFKRLDYKSKQAKGDIIVLALNLYHEVRSSTDDDKYAAAVVTYHRLKDKRFPKQLQEVIFEKKQFSWTLWHEKYYPKEEIAWYTALNMAEDLYENPKKIQKKARELGLNDSCLWYTVHSVVDKNAWTKKLKIKKKIGAHTYMCENDNVV